MADRCEFPPGCGAAPDWNVMGAYPGDWAVYVCDEHRGWAHRAFAPWIEYPVRHPATEPPGAVRSDLTPTWEGKP